MDHLAETICLANLFRLFEMQIGLRPFPGSKQSLQVRRKKDQIVVFSRCELLFKSTTIHGQWRKLRKKWLILGKTDPMEIIKVVHFTDVVFWSSFKCIRSVITYHVSTFNCFLSVVF